MRKPQQARSRRTLTRIVRAATALIEERGGPESLTIQDVVERAGTSVGAFYARFSGRDDLIRYIAEEARTSAEERWDEVEAAIERAPAELEPDLERILRGALALVRDHPEHARPDPKFFESAAEILARRHEDLPGLETEYLFWFMGVVIFTSLDRLLEEVRRSDPHFSDGVSSEESLVRALARLWAAVPRNARVGGGRAERAAAESGGAAPGAVAPGGDAPGGDVSREEVEETADEGEFFDIWE